MSAGIGSARAMAMAGRWQSITHIGGNSGGNWAGAQLVWSEHFSPVFDTSVSLEDFMVLWGETYTAALNESLASGEIAPYLYDSSHNCPLPAPIWEKVDEIFKIIEYRGLFPATNWEAFTTVMLRSWIANLESANASLPRTTLGDSVTFVQQLSLPPDAYVSTSSDALTTTVLEVGWTPNASETAKKWHNAKAPNLPVAFVSRGSPSKLGAYEFLINQDIEELNVKTGRAASVPLVLNPSLMEITSGSSAAAGEFGSKSLLNAAMKVANISVVERELLMRCLPVGLEGLASAISQPPTDAEQATTPNYRYIDGGQTDDTALAFTIAAMQRDCNLKRADLDCSSGKPWKLVLTGGGNPNAALLGNEYKLLFTDTTDEAAIEATTPGNLIPSRNVGFAGDRPSSTVFKESYPPPDEWKVYQTFQGDTSLYWHGQLTTIENRFFGVSAGQNVELLILSLDKADHLKRIIAPGFLAATAFKNYYGPLAASQANSTASILEAFFA